MIKSNLKGLTVKELKEFLSNFDDDTVVCCRNSGCIRPAFMVQDNINYQAEADEEIKELKGILIR